MDLYLVYIIESLFVELFETISLNCNLVLTVLFISVVQQRCVCRCRWYNASAMGGYHRHNAAHIPQRLCYVYYFRFRSVKIALRYYVIVFNSNEQ